MEHSKKKLIIYIGLSGLLSISSALWGCENEEDKVIAYFNLEGMEREHCDEKGSCTTNAKPFPYKTYIQLIDSTTYFLKESVPFQACLSFPDREKLRQDKNNYEITYQLNRLVNLHDLPEKNYHWMAIPYQLETMAWIKSLPLKKAPFIDTESNVTLYKSGDDAQQFQLIFKDNRLQFFRMETIGYNSQLEEEGGDEVLQQKIQDNIETEKGVFEMLDSEGGIYDYLDRVEENQRNKKKQYNNFTRIDSWDKVAKTYKICNYYQQVKYDQEIEKVIYHPAGKACVTYHGYYVDAEYFESI